MHTKWNPIAFQKWIHVTVIFILLNARFIDQIQTHAISIHPHTLVVVVLLNAFWKHKSGLSCLGYAPMISSGARWNIKGNLTPLPYPALLSDLSEVSARSAMRSFGVLGWIRSRGPFPGVMRPERVSDHSILFTAEVKKWTSALHVFVALAYAQGRLNTLTSRISVQHVLHTLAFVTVFCVSFDNSVFCK
jgi:hypothetical protein